MGVAPKQKGKARQAFQRSASSAGHRKKWLEMVSTIFNVIYKDSDDSRGSLKVVVEKNSAKC